MDEQKNVTFEITGNIGILTLKAPPENYLPVPEFVPVHQFLEWMSDESIKGLIIQGEGKNFSAGGDLRQIFASGNQPETLQQYMQGGNALLAAIEDLGIPVVAAINRVCFGGGLEIALACTIRVASENALLAFPEVNMNLMPGMGGTFRLPAVTSPAIAAQLILEGDMISAPVAKEMGLVDVIAPRDQAFDTAMKLLVKMTHDRPARVIRHVMKAIRNSALLSREEAMREETRMFCELASDEWQRRKNGEEHAGSR